MRRRRGRRRPFLANMVALPLLLLGGTWSAAGTDDFRVTDTSSEDPSAVDLKLADLEHARALDGVDSSDLFVLRAAALADGALGIYLDRDGSPIVVLPSDRGSALVSLDAVEGSFKLTQLNIDTQTIQTMKSELRDLALTVKGNFNYAYFFSLQSGRMVIQMSSGPEPFAGIVARYGDLIELHADGEVERLAGGRFADATPFYGGASINGPKPGGGGNNVCTSAYPAKTQSGGFERMVTAGHGFGLNAQIKSASGNVVGVVSNRDFPLYDAELISNKDYFPRLYSGSLSNNGATKKIYGYKWGTVGQTGICRSGQTTGAGCGWEFTDSDTGFCAIPEGWCTERIYAYKEFPESQGGDSGGPIYYNYSDGVLVHASMIGKGCFIIVGCTFYGEPVPGMLVHYGVSLLCYNNPCIVQLT